jgi:hypothetical protein
MSREFGLLKEIDINQEQTWLNKLFITLDIDWAHDEVIEYVADKLIAQQTKATWFVTHPTPMLEKLNSCPLFELGIHPNFNKLLQSNTEKGATISEVLDNLLTLVDAPLSFRSHSITQSTEIINAAYGKGMKYESNTFIPIVSNIEVRPYQHTSGMIQLPYVWEDDVHFLNDWNYEDMYQKVINQHGLVIIDFHPIHIFLNTEHNDRYEACRGYYQDVHILNSKRNLGVGTSTIFERFINLEKKKA